MLNKNAKLQSHHNATKTKVGKKLVKKRKFSKLKNDRAADALKNDFLVKTMNVYSTLTKLSRTQVYEVMIIALQVCVWTRELKRQARL